LARTGSIGCGGLCRVRGIYALVLESEAPSGQAGASWKIENYLGFSTRISGQELAARAYTQAQKFGAQIMIAKCAKRLACDRKSYAIEMDDGQRASARAVVIATGAVYRRLSLDNILQFQGAQRTQGESRGCGANQLTSEYYETLVWELLVG